MAQTIGSLDLNAFSDLYSDSNQYFWFESDATATYGAGAHVTLVPDTTFISNPTGQNILMNTDGFSIRNGLLPMMTLSNNLLDFNVVDTTAGTYTNVASFGASSTIGVTNGTQSYMALDYHSLRMIDKEGDYYLYISDRRGTNGSVTLEVNLLGDGETTHFDVGVNINTLDSAVDSSDPSNVATISTTNSRYVDFSTAPANGAQVTIVFTTTDQGAKAYTFGTRDTTNDVLGASSVVLNRLNVASGPDSCASGYYTVASGNNAHSEGLHTTASGSNSHAEGYYTTASRSNSHAEGYYTTASGSGSHAEGTMLLRNTDDTRTYTTSSGIGSHAEGAGTTASNQGSHAEGSGTTSSGHSSHAEGYLTIASGDSSHAEGGTLRNTDDTRTYTTASGRNAHAEGSGTTASGGSSHAEGIGTIASGNGSHAQNYRTIAAKDYQTVIGKFNIEDTASTMEDQKAFIIGNGTSSARSNALTVDWDGNITVNNHDSEIGHVYSASKSVAISNTSIDHNTDGASISLPAGTYIVIGQWQFDTRTTSGTTNSAIRLYRSGSGNNIAQTRIVAGESKWNCLQCMAIVELTSTETIKVCGATSRPYTTALGTYINAIRIK